MYGCGAVVSDRLVGPVKLGVGSWVSGGFHDTDVPPYIEVYRGRLWKRAEEEDVFVRNPMKLLSWPPGPFYPWHCVGSLSLLLWPLLLWPVPVCDTLRHHG